MNIIITLLLTVSLLLVAPGCCKERKCVATYIDPVSGELQQEQLACADEIVTSENVKC